MLVTNLSQRRLPSGRGLPFGSRHYGGDRLREIGGYAASIWQRRPVVA
jgi:hypothetical protein